LRQKLANGQRIPVKIMITALFGAVGYGLSYLVDSNNSHLVLSVGTSLYVAGIVLVIQFLYDVEQRLEAMEHAYDNMEHIYDSNAAAVEERLSSGFKTIEDRISSGFKQINEATELFALVEASALKTDAMTQLVRNSTRVEASPPLVFEFAQSEIARLSEMLKTVSEGADVTYEGEDRDWLLGLTKVVNATIDATSLTTVDAGGKGFIDGGLWSSDLGQRYLDVQREAIKRGVAIRRIFIMDRPELLTDPDFISICRMHAELSIAVRILDPSKIPGIRRGSLFDFVIFDGVLSYQATPASRVGDRTRPVIINTQLVTRPLAVQDRIQRFQDLWKAAQDIE
jgi:hypothetical protein